MTQVCMTHNFYLSHTIPVVAMLSTMSCFQWTIVWVRELIYAIEW